MCSTPSIPQISTVKADEAAVATPTYADANVQKAGANTRQQTAALSNRNVKTSSNGVLDAANIRKLSLGLGGTSQKKNKLGE